MYDDHKPAESPQQQKNNHDSDGKPSRDTREEGTRTTTGDGASATKTAAASGEQSTDECSESHSADRAERRTKQVIVTGSAAGWIEVWEAKGLLATAGVDEDAMAAKLQRRQPQERQGVHIRATRLRRSGLACCTPSAASAFVGGSAKSALEALHPVPPSLRWEAHRGSPVSTLCALDKTPLVVTASTDSTIRLFSLADVQVGAQPFKAAGTLGEIDMRDTESVRIDRAEMWSCPSLTAADVRHATEIAAYRAFSKKICTELEDQVVASSLFTPATPSSTEPTPGGVAGENIPAASQSAASTAGRGPSHVASLEKVTEQGLPPSIADHQNAGGTTFLTAVQHEPEGGAANLGRHGDAGNQDTLFPGRGNHGRVHEAYCAPDDRFADVFAAPVAAAPSTQLGAVTTKKNLAGGGKSGMEDRDWQKLIDGNAADLGFRQPPATELGSTAAKPTRGEPAAAKAGIVGLSVEGAARRGSDSLWDRAQSPSDSFDKQRMTLTSARAAKNHLGKVLYGNMYHEIKSGAACNTLVMEYVHRKNPRGDAVIDTEVSPFLKENLTDRLPSLAERRRRRRRQVYGGAKTSNSVNGAPASAKSTGGRDTLQSSSWSRTGGGTNTGTSASTDEAREMLGIERSTGEGTGEGGSAAETSGPEIAENQAQRRQALEEWHPQTDTGSAHGGLPNRDSGVNNSDDNAGKRVQRRPRYKTPVSSGPTKRIIGHRAVPTDQDHTESRRSVTAIEPQHEHAASPILAAGRNRAPIKQEDAHCPSNGNKFDSNNRPVAVVRRDGRVGRRRVAEMNNDHEAPGGGSSSSSMDLRQGQRQITTSASLTTLSLQEMEQRQAYSGSRGAGEDALDSLLHLKLEPGDTLSSGGRTLTKCTSVPSVDLKERWKEMQERFDIALSPCHLDGSATTMDGSTLKSQTKSSVGAYIRRRVNPSEGSLASRFEETNEALLGVANFGTYTRSEVETLGGVFLLFAREGFRFTYDMWRKAMLSNNGVRVLKGLQFGMLDEDNDGEVSLADITRAVFRRAGSRDLRRIRRFLELWLNRERQKHQRRQVNKALEETRGSTVQLAAGTKMRGSSSRQPGSEGFASPREQRGTRLSSSTTPTPPSPVDPA